MDDTGFPPANATPRAQTPERPASSDVDHRFESKRLLTLDRLAVWLPNHRSGVDDELQQPPAVQRPQMSQGMPGTFSAYADLAASRSRVDVSTSRPGRSTPDFGGFPGRRHPHIPMDKLRSSVVASALCLTLLRAACYTRRWLLLSLHSL